MNDHQQKQKEVINLIEQQVNSNTIRFSTVSPVTDYEIDQRMCLTAVHLPHQNLIEKIKETILRPLQEISPEHYYYPDNSLHMTVKNIRTINNPPHFTKEDIATARDILAKTVPQHKKFTVYFYRLLLFPLNVALIGTTDPQLDDLVLDLDLKLKNAGVPDDKKYVNHKYFFSNITLARFTQSPTKTFKKKVEELSQTTNIAPYIVDSVTLLTGNAVLQKQHTFATWQLTDQLEI